MPALINVNQVFQNFPNEEYWKFLMDYFYVELHNDPLLFDKEHSPGYLNQITKAFYYLMTTVDMPLSAELLRGLNILARFSNQSDLSKLCHMNAGSFWIDHETFNFNEGNLEGLDELIETMRCCPEIYLSHYKNNVDEKIEIDFHLSNHEIKQNLMEYLDTLKELRENNYLTLVRVSNITDLCLTIDKYIEKYYQAIANADTNLEKIAVIVDLVQGLHQLHPFVDGNGRIFVFLILNKLLLQNNLKPTMIFRAGNFTGYAKKELTQEILTGQERFTKHCEPAINKSESFLSYLKSKVNLADYDLVYSLLHLNSQFVFDKITHIPALTQEQLRKFWDVLMFKYDENIVEQSLKIFPPQDDRLILELLNQAAYLTNYPLLLKLSKLYPKQFMQCIDDVKYLTALISQFQISEIESLLEKVNSYKIFNALNAAMPEYSGNNFVESSNFNSLFRNLVVSDNLDLIELLLGKLRDNCIQGLLIQDMQGINGLQLLAIFSPSLFNKYRLCLPPQTQKQLLAKPITTTGVFEVKQLQTNKLSLALDELRRDQFRTEKKIDFSRFGSRGSAQTEGKEETLSSPSAANSLNFK